MSPLGALLGLAFAVGAVLAWSARHEARPRIADRVGPYVAPRAATSRLLLPTKAVSRTLDPTSLAPGGLGRAVLLPAAGKASGLLERLGSTRESVARRLDLLGATQGVDAFRLEQLLWGSIGLGGGLALALLLALTRGTSPVVLALAVAAAGLAGALARDRSLARAVGRRRERIAAALPTTAELLALAVGAGESPAAALDRVGRTTQGDLAEELLRALADVRSGTSLTAALGAMARRVDLPELTRFTDGIAVATERGSPLAQVLRAQAADCREASKRALLESGGRREIAMLGPVVFLILPLTVLFALFPGLAILENGLG